MAKMKELKNFINEVVNLFVLLFRSYKTYDDPIIAIPTSLKKMGIKKEFLNLFAVIITLVFAFLLKVTNVLIEEKMIILGICCFLLYYSGEFLRENIWQKKRENEDLFEELFETELILRGSVILGQVVNRVIKFEEKSQLYITMSNEVITNTIRRFLTNVWNLQIKYIFYLMQVFSIIAMLITSIITNTSISQQIFIPLILAFIILKLFSEGYCSMHRNKYLELNREHDNKRDLVFNDLLRIPFIIKTDLDMRISKINEITIENKKNMRQYHNKRNNAWNIDTFIEMLSKYGIIIAYISQVDFETISLSTIAIIIANLAIVQTALNKIGSLIRIIVDYSDLIQRIQREEQDMQLILQTFHTKNHITEEPKSIKSVHIPEFSVKYIESSKNDKPFTLHSNSALDLSVGEVVILEGASGSGKSTFIKLLTGAIRLEKSTEIQAFERCLHFDETLQFGSLSIYEELFCCSPNPNLEKMQRILKNLGLWQEIGKNCLNIWQWMKEKQFSRALSNGQKQRLILAKMLYWVDDSIDVLALDESTSGLDATSEPNSTGVDAEKVLEYIIRYANSDKKRIIIISTHQNLDGLTEKLSSEFVFKKLYFSKEGENNIIKKI